MKQLTDEQEETLLKMFEDWTPEEITKYLDWVGDIIDPYTIADIYTDELCDYDPIITEFNDRALDNSGYYTDDHY